jgi:diguanylate cyclase (GGDEF)-like protein/PAS domain S-box-containing protein
MVNKSSVQTLHRLLDGARSAGLITLDAALHVNCATPHAGVLCGWDFATSNVLPPSLQQAVECALRSNASRLIWKAGAAGESRGIEIHVSPISDPAGATTGCMLILLDATDRILEEEDLRSSNAILSALLHFDWQLQSAPSWEKALQESIALIGTSAGFARIQVFRTLLSSAHTSRLSLVLQWEPANGSSLLPGGTEDFPGCTRWIQMLKRGEPIFGTLDSLPLAEQALMKRRQTQAMALVPVFAGETWWGGISFERCREEDTIAPDEISALVSVGRSLGLAIQRQLAAEGLNQAKIAFDTAAEGIMICDDKKRITAVNKGFTDITGYSEDEAIGRTPEMLSSNKSTPEFYAAMWQEITQHNCWRGEIWNRRKSGEMYPQWMTITSARNREGQVTHYVAVFADISESKASQERLHQLVNHDPLTGLPNRRLLNELLERALKLAARDKTQIALLFVDLDRFKSINDTMGHHAGDLLLTGVTHRLMTSVRECDTVARLSGDEFIIMLDGFKQADDVSIVAKKIIKSLQESFIIDGKEIFIGASVGISLYPQDGADANDLIKAADIAMYQVKADGRNGFRYYTSQLSEFAHERLNLDTQLRHALERNELVVHYQPQISLKTGRIIGAEALVRWQHPEMGMIPPGKFIPLAEETGLIIQIGEWVLRQAALDVLNLDHAKCPLQWISVNVSAMQVLRSNFADTVYGVLVETGCDPEKLELEITESAIMNSAEYVIDVCRRLKDMGVKLALDDFGTGYSSLSYLKRFPLDKLKIDQSFVRELPHDAEDIAISGAIIGLGHNLGLTVIAEGVEKLDQETFLRSRGCQEAQGYLYSRPVPFDRLVELLQAQDQPPNEI